ncbi:MULTISPECIES: hypothetical protein [unclassified Candidatus Frackibacter]|jgi:ferredoxin|uniref:hypothetical protein n=1 Tax=unclassified Candidatus Frackibacter TaxID=2648818 RepID=UPI000792C32E|nr:MULTISPECIES: hypothetical protein [unclassified Candidatus Frackibacter]KXS43439.1 MAG: hypothetical protein AWU54_1020 [Candidatus Frackibacter sp. T328-2]SDC57148.1 hypothetical protein SAMN04515661_11433 [Candidatus Frackibacter sp. WG11]SEM71302.1 hypothetical protein SAMN04488698_11333 [Candidatus Frackibacter sp. WG12]SFL82996.1 hypothetical protein SAMN04488699_11550 [Candidatus Frackibacter sp. WG13]
MADQDKPLVNQEALEAEKPKRNRQDDEQPLVLPGIHRYQFFTNLKDRMLTKNLNRLAMAGIATATGGLVAKPIMNGVGETIYCLEDRACYATLEHCAVGIKYQAELTVATRVADYERFIRNGGLKCIGCGNCVPFCTLRLDLPHVYKRMQEMTMEALKENKVPKQVIAYALKEGLIGAEYIETVSNWYQGKS